jgi:hypothetical protein
VIFCELADNGHMSQLQPASSDVFVMLGWYECEDGVTQRLV